MYNRPYTYHLYDTASPEHWKRLEPDFIIICFDINDRRSLENAKMVWRKEIAITWGAERDNRIPTMLLGLKRDLREVKEGMIYPQEV